MKKQLEDKKTVASIYNRVREILETARSSAYRAVNFAMVQAYWHIGREIVEEEQRGKAKAGYGEHLLKDLSQRLTKDFGKGFDYSNVKNMRQFYLIFPIGDAVRRQLGWTHYRLLTSRDKKTVKKEIQKLEPSLKPEDIIKDPYVLEFLNVKENIRFLEKDLEIALIGKLQDFLLELGKGFSFVGRQNLTITGQLQ